MSLTGKFTEYVLKLVEVQFAERRISFNNDIKTLKARASAEGTLHSGWMIKIIRSSFEREIDIRAIMIWQNMVRVFRIMQLQIGPSTSEDLKEFFRESLLKVHGELDPEFYKQAKIGAEIRDGYTLWTHFNHIIAKHEVEIDLFVESITCQSPTLELTNSLSPEYHFYGTVGAIQTGTHAAANIVQNIGPQDINTLLEALQQVEKTVSTIPDLTERQKAELVATVDECKTEINSEKPNNMKIRPLLTAIGSTLQSVATAGGVYQTFKTALIPFGIILP